VLPSLPGFTVLLDLHPLSTIPAKAAATNQPQIRFMLPAPQNLFVEKPVIRIRKSD
jgi:hypothetical protein